MLICRVSAIAGLAALCIVVSCGTAKADRRPYLVTYGYYTPHKGEMEIEQWTDSFVPKEGHAEYVSRTELEYGVADRLAASLYLVMKKSAGQSLHYDETKLELRYRLTKLGAHFWDTAGYVEVVRPKDSHEPYEVETKLIFSHEFNRFNLTVNLVGEKELQDHGQRTLGYAIGVAPYQKNGVKYSVELFGKGKEHYVMPAWWVHPGKRQNLGIGVGAGLTGSSDRVQIRTLYAVEL